MTTSLTGLLEALVNGGVEFVLVGGLGALAQGAPVTTFDVDIVHRRDADNVDRLLEVLATVHAYLREAPERRLPPSRHALLGPGHSLLVTDLGPLDCLGTIEGGRDYAALKPHTLELALGGGHLLVAKLELLLELKEQWSDDESKLRAAILRRTLGMQ